MDSQISLDVITADIQQPQTLRIGIIANKDASGQLHGHRFKNIKHSLRSYKPEVIIVDGVSGIPATVKLRSCDFDVIVAVGIVMKDDNNSIMETIYYDLMTTQIDSEIHIINGILRLAVENDHGSRVRSDYCLWHDRILEMRKALNTQILPYPVANVIDTQDGRLRIGVIFTQTNMGILKEILQDVYDGLISRACDVTSIKVLETSDLPRAAKSLSCYFDAIIAIGIVIKYVKDDVEPELIVSSLHHGLEKIYTDTGVPIIDGVISLTWSKGTEYSKRSTLRIG